jgi:two-component system response regulator
MDPRPILLVEDNPDDVELTLRALQKNKIVNEVVVAHDGSEALDLLFGKKAVGRPGAKLTPSLVLLDLKLPKVDGFDVLKEMRARKATRLIPVVILTSSREEPDLLRGYMLGANSYVRKPVDYSQFLMTVQQLGAYWLSVNEPISGEQVEGWNGS